MKYPNQNIQFQTKIVVFVSRQLSIIHMNIILKLPWDKNSNITKSSSNNHYIIYILLCHIVLNYVKIFIKANVETSVECFILLFIFLL